MEGLRGWSHPAAGNSSLLEYGAAGWRVVEGGGGPAAQRPLRLLLRDGGFAVFDDVILSTEKRYDAWMFKRREMENQ